MSDKPEEKTTTPSGQLGDPGFSTTVEDFVPEQVRRAAKRADELMQQTTETTEPPSSAEESSPPREAPPVSTQEATTPEVTQPAASQTAADWERAEQRYRTLQGKYDSEIGQLRGHIRGLEQLLATVQAPPQQQAPQVPPATYNEADIELYGQDMLEAVGRTADARYMPVIARLEAKIRELEAYQQNLTGASHQDRVFRQLDQDPELAGWQQINTSQQFNEWLQEIDEYSGLSRNDMLQHAYAKGDAIRTGRFFKKYMAEHTGRLPLPIATASQTTASARPNGNIGGNGFAAAGGPRLEELAAPGRAAGSGSGNGAPQARLWSRPDIQAFYRDRTRGMFRGREAEAHALEVDLIRAQAEGRIV